MCLFVKILRIKSWSRLLVIGIFSIFSSSYLFGACTQNIDFGAYSIHNIKQINFTTSDYNITIDQNGLHGLSSTPSSSSSATSKAYVDKAIAAKEVTKAFFSLTNSSEFVELDVNDDFITKILPQTTNHRFLFRIKNSVNQDINITTIRTVNNSSSSLFNKTIFANSSEVDYYETLNASNGYTMKSGDIMRVEIVIQYAEHKRLYTFEAMLVNNAKKLMKLTIFPAD